MLRELIVEDLGVIDRAELTLEPGTTALTGETGAGKTLLVAGLSLLLGGRADRGLVRAGAKRALVEGRFEVDASHAASAFIREQGFIDEDEGPVEVIISRTIAADGGGKARVNGRIATVAQLGEVGRSLVEIAGQHEHQRLGTAAFQRATLDAFAGAAVLASEVAERVRAASQARRLLERLQTEEGARERALDLLRYEIGEIEAAGVVAGEFERLQVDAARLEHAEAIARSVSGATEHLRAEGGAEEHLMGAAKEVANAVGSDPSLTELSERLERSALEVADISAELAGRTVAPDPEHLEATRSRIAVLSRLHKKYGDAGGDDQAVLDYLENARARLEELNNIGVALEEQSGIADSEGARALAAATELSALRAEAAPKLERALAERLRELAIPDASVRIVLEDHDLYEGGLETVTFEVALSSAAAERPIAKVASGGELSRVALALHVLTADSSIPTMVFDEVDAGVGGKAAQSVGKSLAELARNGTQVFLVTHLPQVAAFADSHLRVVKENQKGAARVRVETVAGEERIGELSRMLAGLESERAREHARELLAMASSS